MPSAAPLTLFNSLSRALEPFVPIDAGNVRVYSCGPTVYARQHLGNMRAYIFTDTLTRVLRWKGYPVTHVINITDVGHLTSDADAGDDKIERAAAAEQLSAWDVAQVAVDHSAMPPGCRLPAPARHRRRCRAGAPSPPITSTT